jgi:hypothetical protein
LFRTARLELEKAKMIMIPTTSKPKFPLGHIVATPDAIEALFESQQSAAVFLDRHATGDWGNLSDDDKRLNDEALVDGSRILSAYKTRLGTKLWIITEAADDSGHRVATTVLLPEEY